ncbi:hypothetical protein D3C86_1823590 [compost metagenome]
MEAGGAEVAQQGAAFAAVQHVMPVQVAMHDAARVQMARRRSDAVRDGEGRFERETLAGRVDVAGAAVQAGRAGQVGEIGGDQRHHQGLGCLRVVLHLAQHRHQAGVRSGADAGRHFAVRQAVAGDRAFI